MDQFPNQPGVNTGKVASHIRKAWMQTIGGILLLAGLSTAALFMLGMHWSILVGLMIFWLISPIYGWFNSAKMVKKLMRCDPPNPFDPRHQRLERIVDELFPLTGLKVKPPVYVSPMPVPNAFATGRNQNNAFIAATEGLLSIDLTDDELKAVIAHELAHIKSNDVTITSFTAVLGSIFALILAQGLPAIFNPLFCKQESKNLLGRLEKKTRQKKRFFAGGAGVGGLIFFMAVFFIAGFFARLVTLFVSRSRESHADALAVAWTQDPCALSSALQKITLWMSMNIFEIRIHMLMSGLAPMLFVSLHDDEDLFASLEGDNQSSGGRLRQWWQRIGQQHPPIPERLKQLDEFRGDYCPRIY